MKLLIDERPDLISEWSSKNTDDINTISYGSRKKIIWECSLGHEWIQDPNNRTNRNSGCPVCAGKVVKEGFNDLKTLYPDIAAEWSSNNSIMPSEITPKSHKKVLWNCIIHGDYPAIISNRTQNGTGCTFCSGRLPSKTNNLSLSNVSDEWSEKNKTSPSDYTMYSDKSAWWVCENGHEWETVVRYRTNNKTGCPTCNTGSSSVAEREIADYIESFIQVNRNDRDVVSPLELDIYIPEKRIAVEYNGLYWHSFDKVGKTYHYDKWKKCRDAGIQLITIWEDDYRNNKGVTLRMIKSKILGRESIGARKTKVVGITRAQSNAFLSRHHIQGPKTGSMYVGLTYDDELVAVMVSTRTRNYTKLDRYASSIAIVGGLDRMMKHASSGKWITFSDNCVSTGELYESAGWYVDAIIPPDYQYIVNNSRSHKFNYRRSRFLKDKDLYYNESMSESELAVANGIARIYDCGKIRYAKNISVI